MMERTKAIAKRSFGSHLIIVIMMMTLMMTAMMMIMTMIMTMMTMVVIMDDGDNG